MNSKEKYELLDKLQLCHRCEKAKQFHNRKYCENCLEKISNENAARYSKEKAHEYQTRRREIYKEKKQNGICVRCSKKATHGIYCYDCFIKAKINNKKTSEKRKAERHERGLVTEFRKENGLCLQCGEKAYGTYCEKCQKEKIEILKKAREKSPFREMEKIRIEKVRYKNGKMGNSRRGDG